MANVETLSQLQKTPPKNATLSWTDRELGRSKKATGPPQCLQLAAEEQLILKDHQEFPCSLPDETRSTFLMVYSPDGSMIASTHGNHNVYVTDARSGCLLKTLSGHPRTPWCIAFHPSSNQILASGCLGGQVRVWDLHGGSEIWNSEKQTVIASLAFHPTDRVLVIASYNEIMFWDWSHAKPFAKCSTANLREKVRYVSFDQHGHKLVTGIANVQPRQSQWDRVSAPQPSPHTVSQLDHERRITICYRYMVEQYEQLVERYIQLSSQGPGGSTNYYLRRVPVPPQTIDRGTDPMDESSPSTSSGLRQQVRCSICRGNLIGGHPCPGMSSGSETSSSSTFPSSSLEDSTSTTRRSDDVRRPRGTNEISASHSSSIFLNPTMTQSATSPNQERPPPGDSSLTPQANQYPGRNNQDRLSLPSDFVRASTLYDRLNQFRAQVVSGRNILTRTRTISRLSPSAPEDVNYLIDDALSESLPSRPALGIRHMFAPRRNYHITTPSSEVNSEPSHVLQQPSSASLSENESVNQASIRPPRERRSLEGISPARRSSIEAAIQNVSHLVDIISRPAPDPRSTRTSSTSAQSGESILGSQRNDREAFTLVCPRGCMNPQSFNQLSTRRRWTLHEMNRCLYPDNYSSSSCLSHNHQPSLPQMIEQRSPVVGVDSSDNISNSTSSTNLPSHSSQILPASNLEPTPTFPPLPPNSPPPRASAPLFSPRSSIDSPASTQTDSSLPHAEDTGAGTDSSSAIGRLRAQFRRLQSVYNDNRSRESMLLRGAAQNAERRLMLRLSNLFGRAISGRSASSYLFQPEHDLRSIRYGLQFLRRNIYLMARFYRFIVDRRRLDRIWRLWLDLQSQIFFLQRAVRDEETEERQQNQPEETTNNPSTSTEPIASLNSTRGCHSNTSPTLVQVTPSCSSANNNSHGDKRNTSSSNSLFDVLSSASCTGDNTSPQSSAASSTMLPLPTPRRFRFCRSHQRPFRRPRFDHPHRVPGRGLLGYCIRPGSHNQSSTSSYNGNSDGGNEEECHLLNWPFDSLTQSNPRRKPRYRRPAAPGSLVSDPLPSSSRFNDPLRGTTRGRVRCNRVRIFPRLTDNSEPHTFQLSSPQQSSGWSSESDASASSSWNPESLRSRARHMLFLMLDSLTQFFENDMLIRPASAENSNEMVTNLTSLLELASNLTKLLLTQLRNSRAIPEIPRRRVFRRFVAFEGRGPSRNEPEGSSSTNNNSRPATDGNSEGSRSQISPGMRLPLLMVNDNPVPPESDGGPDSPLPPVPPRSYSPALFPSQFQSPQFIHSRHPTPLSAPSPADEPSDDDPSPHDRNDVLYLNIGFPNGPPLFSTEAPSATHHRVQVWDFSKFVLPEIDCSDKNVVVPDCKIHNDASVDISKDGSVIVTLLPAGRLSHITTMLGVYSLSWDSLGQCLYTTSFEQNAVSVSLSPTNRHLVVGLASRRITFLRNERQIAAQIFRLEGGKAAVKPDSLPTLKGKLTIVREIIRESADYMKSINCIRWSPVPGQGFIFGTNSGKLKIIR